MKRANNIPPFDVVQQYEEIRDRVSEAALEILASGRYIGGSPVADFEKQFADYVGVSDAIACNSGTDALYLALRALEIGPGDEVIVPPFTFIATAEVVSEVGATPVFVDIEPTSFNLDPALVEAAITSKTRAIIPVHLFGHPADMTLLMAVAGKHNLAVIEDCAQATGAKWAGESVGSIGPIGCFSFYPTKNLGGCGDGGMVTTNDAAIAAKIRSLTNHGSRERYFHEAIGINSRLDAIQAAILQIKLSHLDRWNEKRSAVAARYSQLLAGIPGLTLPTVSEKAESVWNQYTIRIESANANLGGENPRDWVRSQLQEQGIGSAIYYPLPLHLQPVYEPLGYQKGQFPVSEQAAQTVLSLPMFPELQPEQQEAVAYALKECLS